MAILNKVIPAAMAVILAGCYENFTPDVDCTPVLCVNSLVTAGLPIDVQATHTWLYDDLEADRDHSVGDATIAVYANGSLTDGDYVAREGDRIRIEADSPTYGHADAEVVVPVAVPVKSIEWTPRLKSCHVEQTGTNGLSVYIKFDLNVNLTLQDRAGTEDYYRFDYTWFNKSVAGADDYINKDPQGPECYLYAGSFDYDSEPLFSEHIGVFESIMGGDSFGFTFFTDRQINGKEYTMHLRYTDVTYILAVADYDDEWLDCGFELTLKTISESFYKWMNYNWQVDNGPLEEIGSMGLGDPLSAYSNVSTGAGIVAAQSWRSVTINFGDFLRQAIVDADR